MKITAIVDACHQFPEVEGGVYTQMMKQTTVIKKLLDTLRQTNVDRIIVITGYENENLEKHIAHRGTACVYYKDWDKSTFPLWTFGLKAGKGCDRVLVLKGNMPLLTHKTIRRMAESEAEFLVLKEEEEELAYAYSGQISQRISQETSGEEEKLREWMEKNTSSITIMEGLEAGEGICIHSEQDLQEARQSEVLKMESSTMSCFTKLMISRGEGAFGPGVAHFFTLIDETGSMASACKSMEMSYSRGWTMVKNVEDSMGFPFLERKSGGKGKGCSKLTQKGREFLEAYYAMEEDIQRMSQALFALHFGDKF